MHIQRPVLVVSQGGLAPVAVRLAARECDTWIGSRAVAGLVLSSPPEWDAMEEGYDRMEARARCRPSLFKHREPVAPMQPVTSTHHFHRRWSATSGYSAMFSAHRRRSPVSAGARCAHDHSSGELTPPHIMHASHEPNDGDASNPIESSPCRFFSDRFLFASSADDRFLDACEAETGFEYRWPVLAFNAGLVGMTPLREEMAALRQPVLVLFGESNGKPTSEASRRGYRDELGRCIVRALPGRNVLPWESAALTAEEVARFADEALMTETVDD